MTSLTAIYPDSPLVRVNDGAWAAVTPLPLTYGDSPIQAIKVSRRESFDHEILLPESPGSCREADPSVMIRVKVPEGGGRAGTGPPPGRLHGESLP